MVIADIIANIYKFVDFNGNVTRGPTPTEIGDTHFQNRPIAEIYRQYKRSYSDNMKRKPQISWRLNGNSTGEKYKSSKRKINIFRVTKSDAILKIIQVQKNL